MPIMRTLYIYYEVWTEMQTTWKTERVCSIKTTPQALYTGFLNTIPQHSSSHIHTHFTNLAIQKLGPNTILGTPPPPPEIHPS